MELSLSWPFRRAWGNVYPRSLMKDAPPKLRSRLLGVLTALFLGMGLFCVVLTGGSLYWYYHSTLSLETERASDRFENNLDQLRENLLLHAELLMRINRWTETVGGSAGAAREMEAQALSLIHI